MNEDNNITILEQIDQDHLKEAFERVSELFREFNDLELKISQLSAQFHNIQKSKMLEIDERQHLSYGLNRIRYHFRDRIREFYKQTLPKYFDVAHFDNEINDLKNHEALLAKIMRVHLVSMGYDVIDNKLEAKEGTSLGIIYGRSSILLPLFKKDTNFHAMAQVLRQSSLEEQAKYSLKQLVGLRHRNVIKVLDCRVDLYPFFLIIEYIYGKTLSRSIQSVGPRPVSQVVDWLYQLADALLYLNQKNILHFNIRPSKIYIDDEFHIMISPVDIRLTDNMRGESGVDVVNYWEVCKYGSPEMLSVYGPDRTYVPNFRYVCAADQYSLGIVAYYVLTGEDLFAGDSIASIIKAREAFEKDPESRLGRLEKLPRFKAEGNQLIEIIRKLLKTDPSERFSSLHSLIRALHHLIHADLDGANIVQRSYRRAMANNRELIRDFYERLINDSTHIKNIFESIIGDKKRMGGQYAMLQMAIDIIINLDEVEYREKFTKLFGRQNDDTQRSNPHKAVEIEDYVYFLSKLVESVGESDPDFKINASIQAAWQEVSDNFMKNLRRLINVG